MSPFASFLDNVQHNLFQAAPAVFLHGLPRPILKVKFDFPNAVYQGLVIYPAGLHRMGRAAVGA